MRISKIRTILLLMLIGTGSLLSQSAVKDSSWLYTPEKHFWFPNSMPALLYNRAIADQSHTIWNTAYHTAAPVPVGSLGPAKYTKQLKGIIPNTTIGKVVKQALADNINVILVIGDGMGTVHMTLPVYMNLANANNQETMFEKIMREGESGFVLTNTVNGLVTCSAAAGTALATGTKTRVNMVSVDSTGQPLESVLVFAAKKGMKTAVVSDASITDATPAAFYGHAVNRDDEESLAYQLANDNYVDVILGGGASLFIPNNKSYKNFEEFANFPGDFNQFSGRSDSLNLIASFQKNGYTIACSKKEMEEAPSNKKLIGLFAAGGLPSPINRDSSTHNVPTVSQMAQKALSMVSRSPKGYFSMIECAQIDWEAHSNDVGGVYKAVLEMDDILKVAYDFYTKNPSKTLLIFTADHETGGLSIAYTKVEKNEIEKYTCLNGETWVNNTNPLYFKEFKNLSLQKLTIGKVFGMSKSLEEFRNNIKKFTGYEISIYEAGEIYQAYIELHGNVKIK